MSIDKTITAILQVFSVAHFKKPVLILILMLTLFSSAFLIRGVIIPHVEKRILFEQDILSGNKEAPYQYRIFKPLMAKAIQLPLTLITQSPIKLHIISYSIIVFICFYMIYHSLYRYLKTLFPEKTSMLGLFLFQAIIPFVTTGYYMIGDYINFMLFTVGFLLIFKRKYALIPVIIFIGTFNRMQIVLLLAILILHMKTIDHQPLRKTAKFLFFGLLAFSVSYLITHLYFGFKQLPYSLVSHVSRNLDFNNLLTLTIPLWLVVFFGFVFFSIKSFKKSIPFFKYAFIGLSLYLVAFFFRAYLWELAKFTPAFLILIPMTLQGLTGEMRLTAQKTH